MSERDVRDGEYVVEKGGKRDVEKEGRNETRLGRREGGKEEQREC